MKVKLMKHCWARKDWDSIIVIGTQVLFGGEAQRQQLSEGRSRNTGY